MTHPMGDSFTREPEPERVVRASVEIAAPPEAVFGALADPRELAAWLGGAEPIDDAGATSDAGRVWRASVRAPDGTPASVAGEYLLVDPPRRLESTWRASWTGFAPERVRFELVPIEVAGVAGTRVTVTHTVAELRRQATTATTPTVARVAHVAVHDAWPSRLARLAAYAAAAAAAARWGAPPDGDPAHWFDALHRRVVAIHQGEST